MNKKKVQRILACLMAVVLVLGLCAPLIRADEASSVIRLRTKEDWERFSQSCRLDTWSQDKTVILEADLDLSGCQPVPTFGGSFDGGGHTLRNFRLSGEGDHQGLFRYLQPGGSLSNLTVRAQITAGENASQLGGIVGVNSGTLTKCTFEGLVSGGSSVGGLVGVNAEAGHLNQCVNKGGSVSGEHYTGGVVGSNYGTLSGCTNAAQVNTKAVHIGPQLDQIDLNQLNSAENMPACTDSGGVAGVNTGRMENCSNSGTVGYPHVGYNVGGVAGRQSGYMAGCSNSGLVQGRKEVGGIVGQMEPYTLLRYEEDTLQKLGHELDVLNSLLSGSLTGVDSSRQQLSAHISALISGTGDAKEHLSDLMGQVEELGNGTADTFNELSQRVSNLSKRMGGVAADMERAARDMGEALDRIEEALNGLEQGDEAANALIQSAKDAVNELRQSLTTILDLLAGIPVPLQELCLGGAVDRFRQALETLRYDFQQLMQAGSHLEQSMKNLHTALDQLPGVQQSGQEAAGKLEAAFGKFSSAADALGDSLGQLSDILDQQGDLPPVQLPTLSPDFHAAENKLSQSLSSLMQELEGMNRTAGQAGDVLTGNLRQVGDQFGVIVDLLKNGKKPTEGDRVVDVSDENINAATQGKVFSCTNTGTVEGDVNVGGITGAMSIEFDFDPEDDVSNQGSSSMNFQFLTQSIQQNCVNRGKIASRKDCAGGLVGRMDLGVVLGGQSFGPVSSSGGGNVGGAAGLSKGVIRDCWVKASLSGQKNVGGIAGTASDVRACRALVDIADSLSCTGAIAGSLTDGGKIEGNTFVSPALGGVDGISYAGKAYPLTHADFMAQPGTPAEFATVTLTFTADGQVVETLDLPYGTALTPDQIPAVPGRENCFGSWAGLKNGAVLSDLTLEAQYAPMLPSISSEDGRILAEGFFTPEAELTITALPDTPHVGGKPLGAYGVGLSGGENDFTALRVALPKGCNHADLYALNAEGRWEKLDATREGRFLRAEISGQTAQLCLAAPLAQDSTLLLVAGAAALLVAALLLLHFVRVKRKEPAKEEVKSK